VDVLKVALEGDERKERKQQAPDAFHRNLGGWMGRHGAMDVVSRQNEAETRVEEGDPFTLTSKGSPVNSSPASLRYERSIA
jgi:hypothetical protein